MSLMNLQLLGTSHTIHSTACVTHEPTTIRYKSHNPFNCLCHSWTYNHQVTQSIQLPVSLMNHQVQVTQSIQMYMSLMNLQLLGTSHTIHSTACVTHEPTTVRYKSHNPFNCLCHSWTYNHQVQVTQSIQLPVSLTNIQPSGTSHTIHSTDCATHEPTTVRYKSHNPFNWLCHPWTYNRQVQVTQSIQLIVPPMNLQPSGTNHTTPPDYEIQVYAVQCKKYE